MYVDESGDTGLVDSQSNEYYLSAIIAHESFWMKLIMKEEIHASEYLSKV